MYDVAPRRLRVSNPMARPSRVLRACTVYAVYDMYTYELYGPLQYGGSGWSGAWPGQDPSEVLGGPAAGSGEIRRGQPKSGQFWL